MSSNPAITNEETNYFSYDDVRKCKPKSSRDIMSVLEGLEETFQNIQRLKGIVIRNKKSSPLNTPSERSFGIEEYEIHHKAEPYKDKRFTEDQHAEVRLPGILRHRRSSNISLNTGNEYKPTIGPKVRHKSSSPSGNREHRTDEYFKIQTSVNKSKEEGPVSYVDFSASHPEVKWHYGSPEFTPQNLSKIGYTKTGTPLYAGRTWDEQRSYLIPAYVNLEEGKCYFGRGGKLWSSDTYEVMECRSLAWDDAKGSPVTELPKFAYKVGFNERDEPLYFGRAFIDGAVTPGCVEQVDIGGSPKRAYALTIPFRGNVLRVFDTYEVMIVLPI